jgi:8-oxo-dGTP pyrophosphatase MutT (NUDIX family)/phosphohistidine phosphatase SixA
VSPSPARHTVRAAGCIVWRAGKKQPEVLLVHRPRYEDWSFPKGKLDRGEEAYDAAIREVEEETGLRVSLGPALPDTHYTVSGGQPKVVHYWCARAPKKSDVSGFRPNDEVDELRWLPAEKAVRRLSYPYDSDLLETFLSRPYDTVPLLVIRHAHARNRKTWKADDTERPLRAEGKEEAHRLVGVLAAYGVQRVVSSDAVRCVDTVLPYLDAHPAKLRLDPSLSEEGFDDEAMTKRVRRELERDKSVAICSHRPVLPHLQEALGLEPTALDPGALLVVHRKRGEVRSVEQLPTP